MKTSLLARFSSPCLKPGAFNRAFLVILEKSRGVGGRVATRRVDHYRVDHGARYLEPIGTQVQDLIRGLQQQNCLQQWTDTLYEFKDNQLQYSLTLLPRYVSPQGMNTVGKFLAEGLEIWCNRRVQAIQFTEDKIWHLLLEKPPETVTDKPLEVKAKSVVIAIPAPQALMLLELLENQLSSDFISQVRSVKYDPCITVMAGYKTEHESAFINRKPDWKAVAFPEHKILDWVGLDSSKRSLSQPSIVVIQSCANFAKKNLETIDLETVGKQLIQEAATCLIPELNHPLWTKVHRWRYAFCRQPLPISCLTATVPLPLVCAGDWCGGQQIDGALASGKAAADWIQQQFNLTISSSK